MNTVTAAQLATAVGASIPDEALDANLGVFGTTGSGKSFATRGLVERVLDRARDAGRALPRVAFCGLNPSTADASQDDPTIRRCVGLAKPILQALGQLRFDTGDVMFQITTILAEDPSEPTRPPEVVGPFGGPAPGSGASRSTPTARVDRPPVDPATGGGGLGLGERSILTACAQHPNGCDREQLSVLCGYKRSSRDKYIQLLTQRGYLQPGDLLTATPTGLAALGDFDPLPTGDALREYWLGKLPAGEAKILQACASVFPQPATREELARETGYKRSSRDKYVQLLAARKLVITSLDGVVASATLFGKGKRKGGR